MPLPGAGTLNLSALLGKRRKVLDRGVEKPPQPYTLTPPFGADPIQPVVPVATANQRQTMFSQCQTAVDATSAVLE